MTNMLTQNLVPSLDLNINPGNNKSIRIFRKHGMHKLIMMHSYRILYRNGTTVTHAKKLHIRRDAE